MYSAFAVLQITFANSNKRQTYCIRRCSAHIIGYQEGKELTNSPDWWGGGSWVEKPEALGKVASKQTSPIILQPYFPQ